MAALGWLPDRVDERRERLDRRREDEDQPGEAQKDRERNQPSFVRLAAPQAAPPPADRPSRAAHHDQPARHATTFLDHVSFSAGLKPGTADALKLDPAEAPRLDTAEAREPGVAEAIELDATGAVGAATAAVAAVTVTGGASTSAVAAGD